jgi:DNA-directed RNA polymerase subunit RPC12/RpoP
MLQNESPQEAPTAAAPPKSGGQRFTCSACGADMQFDPKSAQMKCPYCGHMEAVPASVAEALATVEERPLEAYLTPDASRLATLSAAALQVDCSGCGSTVEFEPPTVAGACPFCGAQIVAQPRAADPLVAPEGVLPFAITQKQATQSIRDWIGSRWFAPNALKQQAQTGAVSGVYVPFWTYDSQTVSYYRGERGEHYWETEWYTDSDGNRQSRQVQKTRWYSASGRVDHFFDDVLVAATHSIPRNKLDALEPWGLENIKAYEPAYLSGFKAQRYQVDLAQGFEVARGVMAGHIDTLVRRDIGGDEQRVHSVDTRHFNVTFKHILLPVYISAYRYQGKVFQVIVNARTGEVQGDRPYSFWKIFFLVLFILAVLFVFYAVSQKGQ